MWFQKSFVAFLHGCSTVNLLRIYKTFFEKNTSETASVFHILCSGNTFCWLALIIYRPEFLDWSKPFLKSSLFFEAFLEIISQLLAVNWSTYHIFISIFSQVNVRCNCRRSPLQVLLKNDDLIYTCYKREED